LINITAKFKLQRFYTIFEEKYPEKRWITVCLAVPAKVLEIKGDKGIVDFGGIRREVNLSLVDNVKIGDYVLIHVGFAIQKIEKKEAEETLKIWQEMTELLKEDFRA